MTSHSLKAADNQLDFVHDTVTMFPKDIALQHTSNGHYCVPLTPKQFAVNIISNKVTNVTFTFNDMSNKTIRTSGREQQTERSFTGGRNS